MARRYRTRPCARAALVERVEIGQEAALARRRQIDRLAFGGERAGGIGRIERIWNQHRRLAGAARHPALGGDRCEKQTLARAVEHQHFAFRIDRARQLVAAAEPGGDRLAEWFDALVGRVAAEVRRDARRAIGPTKGGTGCCGSPTDRLMTGFAGRDAGDQLGQPHERRAAVDRRSSGSGRLALGGHHGHALTEAGRARRTRLSTH